MIVCLCKRVSCSDIKDSFKKGECLKDLIHSTELGTQCGKCLRSAASEYVNLKKSALKKI